VNHISNDIEVVVKITSMFFDELNYTYALLPSLLSSGKTIGISKFRYENYQYRIIGKKYYRSGTMLD